jgi:hypothetical protein
MNPFLKQALSLAPRVALGVLPEKYQWSLHNIVAHPVSEVLYQFGMHEASEYLHDITIPRSKVAVPKQPQPYPPKY